MIAVRRTTLVAAGALLVTAQALHAQSAVQGIQGTDMEEGRKLFTAGAPPAPACALCHTLKDAGATGAVGPDLDDLRPDAARIENALRNGMGPMPAFKSLTDVQVQILVRYVTRATGAPGSQ